MLGTEDVYVVGDVQLDSNNDPIAGSGAQKVEGCLVAQVSSAELTAIGRSGTLDVVRVWLPITTGIGRNTMLKVRGVSYRVDGNPLPFLDPEDPELSGYDITATNGKG